MRFGQHAALAAVLTALLAFAGCEQLLQPAQVGSLRLSIDGSAHHARSIGPEIDVEVARYEIRGESDGGETFERTTSDGQIVIEGLSAGYWQIEVDAYSADDVLLYTGSERALVTAGEALVVVLSLDSLPGFGEFSLEVGWPDDAVQAPAVEATLIPASGPAIKLEPAVNGASAVSAVHHVDGGYYTLVVKVHEQVDGATVLVAGAAELVQVVSGHATVGRLSFTSINAPGSLEINIDVAPGFTDSLGIAITGGGVTVEYGSSASLEATTEGSPGNVVYTWYVNGSAVETGSASITIDGYVPGYYRVDLIAVTADGREGGTATSWVEIAQPAP